MKRILVPVMALVAILAIGTIADAAKPKPKKVDSKVNVSYAPGVQDPYNPYDPYSNATFSGKVKVKGGTKAKKACRKGRTVKVRGIGSDKTNKKGNYSISGGGADAPDGNYRAIVKKKKKGSKIICTRSRSNQVAIS